MIEVLEQPDLLQELAAPNAKLVEYLREPEIMQQLVRLVADPSLTSPETSEPTKETSEEAIQEATKKPIEEGSEDGIEGVTEGTADDHEKTTEKAASTSEESIEDQSTHSETESSETPEDALKHSGDSKHEADITDDSGKEARGFNDHFDGHEEDADDENDNSYSDDDEESRQHFANLASEILASDVWSITEALMESPELLNEIWSILDYPTPLSMNQSSYFTKISEHLLNKKTDEMLLYIKSQDNFVARFMQHIDNPPLMDFLLKVISSDKPDNSTGIIEFLQHQKLIPSLIEFLGPDVSSSVQSAAGDFLKAFVTISANSNSDNTTIGPNELSRELVSEPCIKELVRLMLFGGSGLATGVGVIIEIIRKNNSDYDFVPVMYITMESHPPSPRDPIYLGTLVNIFSENIPKFHDMLVKKHSDILKTPFGEIEPLGFERFKICELVAELLHCSNMALLNDAGGKAIVRARDLERIRTLKEIADSTGGYPPLEYPSHDTDVEPKEETDCELKPADSTDLADDMVNLSLEKPESEEDTEPLPSEASLRASPVVGDKLKIALVDTQIITHILTMFFQFPWNNFLHNVVFDIVQQVLNGSMTEGYNRFLAIDLFQSGKLTYLICDGQTKCAEYQESHKCRLGYMGHLTLISEEVVKFTEVYTPNTISPIIGEVVQEPDWIAYVSETLARTREQYSAILGGTRPEDTVNEINPNVIILRNDEEPIDLEQLYEKDNEDQDDNDDEQMIDAEGVDKKDEASDKFSRYVSQQMTNGGQFGSSDEDDDDDELSDSEKELGRQKSDKLSSTDKNSDEVDSSNRVLLLGSEDDTLDEEEDEDEDDEDDLGLVRSKSYVEMNWDAEEAQKIVDTIKQFKDSE